MQAEGFEDIVNQKKAVGMKKRGTQQHSSHCGSHQQILETQAQHDRHPSDHRNLFKHQPLKPRFHRASKGKGNWDHEVGYEIEAECFDHANGIDEMGPFERQEGDELDKGREWLDLAQPLMVGPPSVTMIDRPEEPTVPQPGEEIGGAQEEEEEVNDETAAQQLGESDKQEQKPPENNEQKQQEDNEQNKPENMQKQPEINEKKQPEINEQKQPEMVEQKQ